MNNVFLIGEIITEPTEVYSKNEEIILYKMSLKVNKSNTKEDESFDVINVKLWKGLKDKCEELEYGKLIAVNGKIQSFKDVNKDIFWNDIYANSISSINW